MLWFRSLKVFVLLSERDSEWKWLGAIWNGVTLKAFVLSSENIAPIGDEPTPLLAFSLNVYFAIQIIKIKENLTKLYEKHNTANKSYDELAKAMERDNYLSADEAVAFGLADKVVSRKT